MFIAVNHHFTLPAGGQAESTPHFLVRITRQAENKFGWEICRQLGMVQISRSTRLFDTRVEAIIDSARGAEEVFHLTIEA